MNLFRTFALISTGLAACGLFYSCSNSANQPKNNNNTPNVPDKNSTNNDTTSVFDKYSTKIDGVIDEFRQGATGDCWLLSELNSLSHKPWGKNIIKNAIKPDGEGGATVTIFENEFEQKQFSVKSEEITSIRNKQKHCKNIEDYEYSTGDADVLAFEIAFEKYFNTKGDFIDALKMKDRSLADVVKLLTGNSERVTFKAPNESSYIVDNYMQLLDVIEKEPNKYVMTVGFKEGNNAGLMDNHAYELKEIQNAKCGHKIVILIDPHNSRKEIKIDYYTFLNSMKHIKFNANSGESIKDCEQLYYEDFKEKVAKHRDNLEHSACKI